MTSFLVDTDLYIDLLNKKEWARSFFKRRGPRIYYCSVTRKELLAGCRSEAERKDLLELLSLHREIKLTPRIGPSET
jgi:predicted nucleic acid-binding protein